MDLSIESSSGPGHSVPIPAPIAMGEPYFGYPWRWSIYGWLPGKAVSTKQVAASHVLAGSLGLFLRALHRVDPTGGPPPGPDNFHRGGSLHVYDAQTRQAISLLGAAIDAKAVMQHWGAALAAPHEGPPMWLHGDVSAGNLLAENGELSEWSISAVWQLAIPHAILRWGGRRWSRRRDRSSALPSAT